MMGCATNLGILPLLWACSHEYARPVQRMSSMSSDALLRMCADSTCKVLALARVVEHVLVRYHFARLAVYACGIMLHRCVLLSHIPPCPPGKCK